MGKKHYGVHSFKNNEGYTMLDWAFAMGSWYLERWWGFGNMVGDEGLYEWFPDQSKIAERDRIPLAEKWDVSNLGKITQIIKKAAIYMGASAVGICKLDRRWIYSHRFDPRTLEHVPIDNIPKEFEYAIVMVHEMDYTLMRTAPAYGEFAAGGRGYSMMAYVASSVAHFNGTPNLMSVGSLCNASRTMSEVLTFGGLTKPDVSNARCLIIWGGNPSISHESFIPREIGRFKKRGGKLIVVDPRKTETAAKQGTDPK